MPAPSLSKLCKGAIGGRSSRSLTRIGEPRCCLQCMCCCSPMLREQYRRMPLPEPAVSCTQSHLPHCSLKTYSQARLRRRQRGSGFERGGETLSRLCGVGGLGQLLINSLPSFAWTRRTTQCFLKTVGCRRRPTLLMHPVRSLTRGESK